MRMQRQRYVGALLGAALAVTAQAQLAGVQFSADMVSRGPDGQTSMSKMYVGDGRMRVEMSQQGREIIRISDQNRRMEWILFPDQQTYMEHGAPAGSAPSAPMPPPSANSDPCAGMQGVTCRRVGEEDIGGRAAVKWEIAATQEGQTLTGRQWIDVQRGFPLRSEMPNGQAMELRLVATEQMDGRPVEKWEMTATAPNQQPTQTFQWYDPELKLSVRQEFPGGYVRELDNIRVGEQPDHLFTVPAGYSQMEMPPPAPRQ